MGSEKKTVEYVNLTNGIEALPIPHARFVRIQSTHCEQACWEDLLLGLSNDLLMHLALGYRCIVHDFGSRSSHGISRAVWQGLPFIKFVLSFRWFGRITKTYIKEDKINVTDHFLHLTETLCKRAKSKIDYFKKFLNTDHIDLIGVSSKTEHDSDFDYYCGVLKKYL